MCGLGWQRIGKTVFPALEEFDIKLNFKEKILHEDIVEVIEMNNRIHNIKRYIRCCDHNRFFYIFPTCKPQTQTKPIKNLSHRHHSVHLYLGYIRYRNQYNN